MNVIQQTIIDHNSTWKRRNLDLLKAILEPIKQHNKLAILSIRTRYEISEKKRLQLLASSMREYGIENNPDPWQQEEACLCAEIETAMHTSIVAS